MYWKPSFSAFPLWFSWLTYEKQLSSQSKSWTLQECCPTLLPPLGKHPRYSQYFLDKKDSAPLALSPGCRGCHRAELSKLGSQAEGPEEHSYPLYFPGGLGKAPWLRSIRKSARTMNFSTKLFWGNLESFKASSTPGNFNLRGWGQGKQEVNTFWDIIPGTPRAVALGTRQSPGWGCPVKHLAELPVWSSPGGPSSCSSGTLRQFKKEEGLLRWSRTLTILGRKGGSTWRWFSWAQSISLKKGCLKMACSPPWLGLPKRMVGFLVMNWEGEKDSQSYNHTQ